MRFYVCIKPVPDIYAPIQIREGRLVTEAGRQVLNAYDASAVEEALVLREAHGGEVHVVMAGPEKAHEILRKALAMGADTGVHIRTDDLEAGDSALHARLLAAYFRDKTYDVLSFGKQSQDTDSGLAGAMVAQLLDLPYATNAVGLQSEQDALIVKRQGDEGQEMIAMPFPCLVTCSNDMNDPRIPNLKGIMASKRKPVETIQASALLEGRPDAPDTRILAYREKPARKAGPKFDGDPAETARLVAGKLAGEAGVL